MCGRVVVREREGERNKERKKERERESVREREREYKSERERERERPSCETRTTNRSCLLQAELGQRNLVIAATFLANCSRA